MEKIIVDETGLIIDLLEERNQELFTALSNIYAQITEEKIENNARKKPLPLKLGARMTQAILTALSKYDLIDGDYFDKLTCTDIREYYQKYCEFLMKYSDLEVPNTKQLFCAYMGITTGQLVYLHDEHPEQKTRMYIDYIFDNLDGMIFASAESGNVDSKSVITRGKIKGAGHNMVENVIETTININSNQKSYDELLGDAMQVAKLHAPKKKKKK